MIQRKVTEENSHVFSEREPRESAAAKLSYQSVLWFMGAVTLGWAMWVPIEMALYSNVGFEEFDDALHLMAASRSLESDTFYHQFPWEWHTRPLFWLVEGDIAHFRTLGGVVLFVVSFSLGWTVVRFGQNIAKNPDSSTVQLLLRALVAFSTGIASFGYYAGMLRSPSYNWVSLVGLVVGLAGLFYLLSVPKSSTSHSSHRFSWFVSVVAFAFALAFALPAKPSTSVFLYLASAIVLSFWRGWVVAWRWMAHVGVAFAGTVLLAMLTTFWPWEALRVIVNAFFFDRGSDATFLTGCSLDNSVGFRRAAETLACVPETFFTNLAEQPIYQLVIFSALLSLVALYRSSCKGWTWVGLVAPIGFMILGVLVAAMPSFPDGSYSAAQRWVLNEHVTGLILVWLGALLSGAGRTSAPWSRSLLPLASAPVLFTLWGFRLDLIPQIWMIFAAWFSFACLLFLLRPKAIVGMLGLLAGNRNGWVPDQKLFDAPFWSSSIAVLGSFVIGFGSSLGAYRLAPLGTVLIASAIFVLVVTTRRKWERVTTVSVAAACVVGLSVLTLLDGHRNPWGQPSLTTQHSPTTVFPESAPILLDSTRSESFAELSVAARDFGWEQGQAIISYSRWGFVVPFVLGAEVVPTLTLAMNWDLSVAGQNFRAAADADFPYDSAWVVVSSDEFYPGKDDAYRQMEMIRLGENFTGLSFPSDYNQVASSGGYSLWKPAEFRGTSMQGHDSAG